MLCRLQVLVLLAAVATSSFIARSNEATKDRYSACYPDRGYTEKDGSAAAAYLWQTATFTNGTQLQTRNCIYKNVNSTIVSVCNGDHRNRTIYKDEVKRGIEQLMKDCGGGGSFNGVHVVNNLTFAAYGILAGQHLVLPTDANPPDLPGGGGKRAIRHRGIHVRDAAGCKDFGFNGVARSDCPKKYLMNTDGTCGQITPDNKCEAFCEFNRTGFLGIEIQAPEDKGGSLTGPKVALALIKGAEVSVSSGISVGLEGIIKDVVGAAVNYEWSSTVTSTFATQISADPSPIYSSRWVSFPLYVQSCGMVSHRGYVTDSGSPCGPGCIPVPQKAQCTGKLVTTEICTTVPYIAGGLAQAVWALRYETADGKPVKLAEQSPAYSGFCTQDTDTQNECPR